MCLWPDAAEHANEIYNHSKPIVPGQNDVVEPSVLERRALSRQAECDLLQERETKIRGLPWGCLAFAIKIGTVRRGSLDPIALQGIVVGWNRRVPHGIKIATFRDDGEVGEVFTSTTVPTRDTVFPLFGDAGTRSATEAELQEFGESVRARPDEAEGPSLALRRPVVEPEEGEENLAAGEEMQVDRGREQPDPEELRARQRGATAQNHGEKTGASRGETRGTTGRRRR